MGFMTTILVIIIIIITGHNAHRYHRLWSSGQVGVQWNCINRTPNQQ